MQWTKFVKLGLLFLIIAMAMGHETVLAQCNADQTFASYRFSDGSTTITSASIFASWSFGMRSDSGLVTYEISEFRKGSNRLTLVGWCNDSVRRNWTNVQMSDTSRTATFVLGSGDTISFYRELSWYNPITLKQHPANFYSPDSLYYAVELIGTNGVRKALLDSLGVNSSIPSGSPQLHGTLPIMAVVKYPVPTGFIGDTAMVRVRVYSRGPGAYYFMRRDHMAANLSVQVQDTFWTQYVQSYGGGLGKRSVEELTALKTNESQATFLSVTPNPVVGQATIEFEGSEKGIPTTVLIYDGQGNIVFNAASSPRLTGRHTAHVEFPSAGTYFVALFHNGTIVNSKKITVIR
jgi:hypothetical protein